MIRLATQQDLFAILEITKSCATDMISKGIYQWNENYPSLATFEKDLNRGELFVIAPHNKIIGAIVISNFMDEFYNAISWETKNDKNIYIHRLCVHPNFQGKGYAQKLMDFAEKKALKERCYSVRLDTFSLNPKNITFYTQRGYKQLGDIYFPVKSKAPFHCFELNIASKYQQ